MRSEKRWRHFYIALSGACLILFVFCLIRVLQHGVSIDTNIKNLAPDINQNTSIRSGLESLSHLAEHTFVVVLSHEDEGLLVDASDSLIDYVERNFQYARLGANADMVERYIDLNKKHRFHLLSESAQKIIVNGAPDELLREDNKNHYGSNAMAQLVGLQDDPSGYLNEYLASVLSLMPVSSEEAIRSNIEGGERFFVQHTFRLLTGGMNLSSQDNVVAEYRKLKNHLNQRFPLLDVYRSGFVFFSSEASRSAERDITLISLGSTLGILSLILIIFRNVKPIILPVVSIFLGITFAFFVSHYFFSRVHIITIVFGASLIGVVVDYSLHYFYFFEVKAKKNTIKLYNALMLSVCTSILGYCALSFSGLGVLRQISFFSVLGLVFSWLMVVTIGPLLTQRKILIRDHILRRSVRRVTKMLSGLRVKFTLLLLLLIVINFLFAFFYVYFGDSPSAFFSPSKELVEEDRMISRIFSSSSFEPASFIVVNGQSNAEVYSRMTAFKSEMNKSGNNTPFFDIDTLVPSIKEQESIYILQDKLFGNSGAALGFLDQQGAEREMIDAAKHAYRNARLNYLLPGDAVSFLGDSAKTLWLESKNNIYSFMMIPKGVDLTRIKETASIYEGVEFLGVIHETERKMRELRLSASALLGVSLLIIATFLFIYAKEFRVLRLLVVPLFSLSCVFAIYGIFSVPVNLFHIMAMFLVIGLGMDYMIFVSEMKEDIARTLSAIVVSAATSLLSFGLLSLSGLPVVSAFGLTVLIGNFFNVVGSFLYAGIEKDTLHV